MSPYSFILDKMSGGQELKNLVELR